MPDQEIPRSQWKDFLRSYVRQHQGWLTQFIAPDRSSSPLLPLRELKLECLDGHDRIVLCFEGEDHVVPHPRHLRTQRTAQGADEGLEMVSDDGDVTRLRFRDAARPDTLDGLAPGERGPRAA